jgi:hypothetical protein
MKPLVGVCGSDQSRDRKGAILRKKYKTYPLKD